MVSMTSSSAKLERALNFHRQGRLAEAASAYSEVLGSEPDNADAMHLLGLVLATMGRGQDAVRLIGAAVSLQPSNAAMHANLGSALNEIGRHDEALACFDRAVALKSDLAAAYLGRGGAFLHLGRLEPALANLEAVGRREREPDEPVEIENQPLGPMPLWGLARPR